MNVSDSPSSETIGRGIKKDIRPRDIVTKEAIDDAFCARYGHGWLTILFFIHWLLRVKQIDYDLKDIQRDCQKTPYLSKIAPSSVYTMHDVHEAGGVPINYQSVDRCH